MTSRSASSLAAIHTTPASAARLASMPRSAAIILRLLGQLRSGGLLIRTPDGAQLHFGEPGAAATLDLHNWKVFDAVLRSGDIGLAETYIDGGWDCADLTALLELLTRNRHAMEELVYGSWWGKLLYRLKHLLNRNSRAGSRKNVHAHYDLGNDFYRLWLDPSMTYSSALFVPDAEGDLARAQRAKYARIFDQIAVPDGGSVLEIGCGWGGFAELAAGDGGVRVTGLTLSREQLDYAQQRITRARLDHLVDLRLCDYRDCDGQFDAIVSIEMFEAVGEAFWPGYFACLARNLKPGARACVQSIVIADALFARYRAGTDFIQQYIFPGGMLPSPSAFRRHAAAQGLDIIDEFSFGIDYACTLDIWHRQFNAAREAVLARGFDERFIRTWEFYLSYCEAAFRAGDTDVMQFTLRKR